MNPKGLSILITKKAIRQKLKKEITTKTNTRENTKNKKPKFKNGKW